MDTRRWQRSRSQVRQRQCLWVCSLVEVTAANSSIAVVPSQASPILKEIARLDALAAQGCTIDDRVYPTKSICIARAFYAYTSLGRHSSERIRRLIAQDAALARKAGDASEFENTLVSIVKMAYKLTTARAARSQTDIMGGQIIVNHNFGGTENGKTRRADPGALCMAPRWRGGARCRAYDIECDPCRYPNCVFRDHLENTLRLREFKPETRVS